MNFISQYFTGTGLYQFTLTICDDDGDSSDVTSNTQSVTLGEGKDATSEQILDCEQFDAGLTVLCTASFKPDFQCGVSCKVFWRNSATKTLCITAVSEHARFLYLKIYN